MLQRLTDVQIAIQIVPTMLRWPEAEIALDCRLGSAARLRRGAA